jgi:DNA-binding transcriptional LysR family regulator
MDEPKPGFSWEDLRLFLAIAHHRTLTAAAVALGVSQPTLGRRLQALEMLFSQPLLQRTRSGYVPTEAGQVVLQHAERIEQETLALSRHLQGGDARLAGLLRVSSSEWFARYVLTPWIAAFGLCHPGVVIELIADTRLSSLDRREADIVFRFQKFEEPNVIQRRFTAVDYGLYAAPGYLARHGMPETSTRGAGHRLIAMDTAFGELADVKWLTGRFPAASFSLRSNSRDIQAEACERGFGIAVLPKAIALRLELIELHPDEPPPGREIWVGFHPDLKTMPRLRALLDFPLEGPRPPGPLAA